MKSRIAGKKPTVGKSLHFVLDKGQDKGYGEKVACGARRGYYAGTYSEREKKEKEEENMSVEKHWHCTRCGEVLEQYADVDDPHYAEIVGKCVHCNCVFARYRDKGGVLFVVGEEK